MPPKEPTPRLPPRAETTTAHPDKLLAIPRVRAFLDRLVEGDKLETAADTAGITRRRARLLIRNPKLRKVFMREIEELRERERPRNIFLAVAVRDAGMEQGATAAQQKVSIEAARYLDGESSPTGITINGGNNVIAGYVVKLDGPAEGPKAITNRRAADGKPLIEHEPVRSDDE